MLRNFWSNVFQGMVGGIFTSIILWLYFKLRDYFANQKGLKELFGIKKELCRYSIIVPCIYVERIKQTAKSKRAISARTHDVPFFAKNDIRAHSIIYRLVKPFCKNVDIKEDENYKFIDGENIICVGGSSNDITWDILEKENPPLHYLRYKEGDLDEIKKQPEKHYSKYNGIPGPFKECLYQKDKNEIYQEDQNHTYSFILKLSSSLNNGTIFVICGLRSEGTYMAAKHLSNNWQKIRNELLKKNKNYLGKILAIFRLYTIIPWKCPDFGIIVKINLAKKSVERVYTSRFDI